MKTGRVVQLPDFFIALELTGPVRKPTDEECEEFRRQTQGFFSTKLLQAHPSGFERLDVHFEKEEFGSGIPEDHFNAYFEVSSVAFFGSASSPSPNDLFDVLASEISIQKLVEYVRNVSPTSPFAFVAESLAQHLKTSKKVPKDDGKKECRSKKAPKNGDTEGVIRSKKSVPKDVNAEEQVQSNPLGRKESDTLGIRHYQKSATPTRSSQGQSADKHIGREIAAAGGMGIDLRASPLQNDLAVSKHRVQSPAFCIAFVSDDAGRVPTKEEVEQFKQRTHAIIVSHLKCAYPDNLESFAMDVGRIDVGEGNPEPPFNLYLDCEAAAEFSQEPPRPIDLFSIIVKCTSIDYLVSMQEIIGSPFETVTLATIRLVASGKSSSESTLKLIPIATEGSRKACETVSVVLPEIFVALVVKMPTSVAQPETEEVAGLHSVMRSFFYSVVKESHPETLVDIDLSHSGTRFGAGLPEKKYNVCSDYKVTLQFRADGCVPPERTTLLSILLKADLGSLLGHVRELKSVFANSTELTIRREVKPSTLPGKNQTKTQNKLTKDTVKSPKKKSKRTIKASKQTHTEESGAEPTPETAERGDDLPTKSPKKKKKDRTGKSLEVLAQQEVNEQSRSLKTKGNDSKKKTRKDTTAGRAPVNDLPSLEPLTLDDEEQTRSLTLSDTISVTSSSEGSSEGKRALVKRIPGDIDLPVDVDSALVRVHAANFYVSLKLDGVDTEPTVGDYKKLRVLTHAFFTKRLKQVYGKNFVKLDLQVGSAKFGVGKPDENYNSLVEWDVQASFSPPSPTDEESDPKMTIPQSGPLCHALVRSKWFDYLCEFATALEGTPFTNATSIFVEQT